MKILITGGAGFIGSHLVEFCIQQKHEIIVIDDLSNGQLENLTPWQKNITFVHENICNFEKILPLFKNVDWVFHLAALADIVPSVADPITYHRANVEGTLNVLEASRLNKVRRFIYSASSSCYGIPQDVPTSEKAPRNPQYPYALTKMLGEEYVLHWGKLYKLPVISLRLFNVYGPRSRTNGNYGAAFGVFLAQKLANRPYTVIGDGSQTRDFIYVTDVVRAFIAAAKSEIKDEIFNVGTGNPQSVLRLVELLEGPIEFIPKRPGEPECTMADIAKITSKLDWSPLTSFEEGVSNILKNLDYWKKAKLWDKLSIEKETKLWFKYLGD